MAKRRRRRRRPLGEAEALCVKVGTGHSVCLTENQQRALFEGRTPREVGRGTRAQVFEAPTPDRVVKITRDASDVAGLLKAQGTGVVPKVHRVFRLRQLTTPAAPVGRRESAAAPEPVYAVEVDRLAPVRFDRAQVSAVVRHVGAEARAVPPPQFIDAARVAALARAKILHCDAACGRAAGDLAHAVNGLRAVGIEWEDLNAENIGRDPRTGQILALDVGYTAATLREEPAILAGAAKFVARRGRRRGRIRP